MRRCTPPLSPYGLTIRPSAGRSYPGHPETIKDLIEKTAKAIQEAMELARPEEATAEFSIGVSGEASVPLLAKGEAESSITVTLTWKRDATADSPSARSMV